MILVDTSVWIDFFRNARQAPSLPHLLQQNEILAHPWILGELMMGGLGPRRAQILSDLSQLRALPVYPIEELRPFVEKERLYGKGLPLVDLQLLYASLIEDCQLWTHDRALASMAHRYGRAY